MELIFLCPFISFTERVMCTLKKQSVSSQTCDPSSHLQLCLFFGILYIRVGLLAAFLVVAKNKHFNKSAMIL